MANKLKSVGKGGRANNYAELYQQHLVRKHGQAVTTDTQTRNVVGKVFLSIDGEAYPTKREATAADRRYRKLQQKNVEQRHQDAVDSITSNADILNSRGFRVTKRR
jgi:hypothetical protein